MLVYYKFSVAAALLDLFPNIGLTKSKFMCMFFLFFFFFYSHSFIYTSFLFFNYCNAVFWRDSNNRRRFFEEYAKEEGFNPLIAADWYTQTLDKLMLNKVSQFSPLFFLSFFLFLFLLLLLLLFFVVFIIFLIVLLIRKLCEWCSTMATV